MLTRRTLAATLPVATTAAAASVAVDPIHAALLRHRVTKAAVGLTVGKLSRLQCSARLFNPG